MLSSDDDGTRAEGDGRAGREELYLGDNAITELPADLPFRLELLGLVNNRVETIPDALEQRVQNLYFAGNPGARREKKRFDAIRKGFVAL